MKILYDDTCILWHAADKLLCKSDGMSKMSKMSKMHNMDKIHNINNMGVHSDEAESGMVVRIDKKANKNLSIQSSQSARKHMKEKHTRRDRYASKKKTTKSSIKNSLSSMMGGFF